MIRVLSAGLLTTVQDLGRPGLAHLGVSAAGAADAVSLRVANRLVGNPEGAAALEMTLRGGRFGFDRDVVVAVVGGDFECSISTGRAVALRAGDVLEVGDCRTGARCYLAVRGGIEAKYELGSASTHLLSGLGLMVERGMSFAVGSGAVGRVSERVVTSHRLQSTIRVTAGAETDLFPVASSKALWSREWTVSSQSNRQGIRLRGGILESPGKGVMDSEGVALGAIQVPPSGEPVILFVDSQTTGGYPVIANVAAVDLCAVGQLRPGGRIRFEPVTFEEALDLLMEQEAWIRDVV